jgi:selenocysteine lyase/cysteine desulfurase
MLRIGLVHYNTLEEVDRLLSALREFASQRRTGFHSVANQ